MRFECDHTKKKKRAELKPFLSSSCWVCLQSVVELRGGGRLGQGRLQLRSYKGRYNCDLILELVWTNQRSTDAHCQLYDLGCCWFLRVRLTNDWAEALMNPDIIISDAIKWALSLLNQQVEQRQSGGSVSWVSWPRPRRRGTLTTSHTDWPPQV